MSGTGATSIEDLSQGRIEARIRELARRLFADQNVDDLETRHLAQVVEHCSRAISDVYRTANLGQILRGETTRPDSLDDFLGRISGSARTPLRRVTQVPEDLKEVGDRCLYDIGMVGVRDYQGLSLETLGIRSYWMAAEILSILAEERELCELFRRNRVSTLPIEKEVEFLRRCAARFNLHAHLLSNLRDEPAPTTPAASRPHSPAGEARSAEAAEEGRTGRELRPGGSPAETCAREPRAEPRERLLSRCERMLLVANTDIGKVRREMMGHVIDQGEAVETLCEGLLLDPAGAFTDGTPPSWLLVGPTGVGKRHLVKSMARVLEAHWGTEIPLLFIEGARDPSSGPPDGPEETAVRLVSGNGLSVLEGFQERASRSPLAFLIVENPEEFQPRLRILLLSILEGDHAPDGRSRENPFEGWVLAFISDQGGLSGKPRGSIFRRIGPSPERGRHEEEAARPLRRALSPEAVARLRLLRFSPLSAASKEAILDREIEAVIDRFRSFQDLQVRLTSRARRRLMEVGFSETQGARPLAAAVRRCCGVGVSRKIKEDGLAEDSGREEAIRHLREMRRGERPFDPETVERIVLRHARVRLPYRTVVIDEAGGEFRYRGES